MEGRNTRGKQYLWPLCAMGACWRVKPGKSPGLDSIFPVFIPGPSPVGGQWCSAPHLKSVPPHFTFGPPFATYIQYCILKMCPPLLLNPGDGPGLYSMLGRLSNLGFAISSFPAGANSKFRRSGEEHQ